MKGAPEWILVGMVKRIHGNAGELLIQALTEREERFYEGRELFMSLKRSEERFPVRIVSSRRTDRGPLVKFAGYDSRDAAWNLFGASLFIRSDELAEPEPDSYFPFQLEGLEVHDGDRRVGVVTAIYESTKANPYLEIDPGGGEKPLFIPFLKAVITGIDLESGRIDIAEGFLGPE